MCQFRLAGLQAEDALLDRAGSDQLVHKHWPYLTDAVRAIGGLRLDRRIPPGVVVDDGVGRGQVQPNPARFEREQKNARIAGLKGLDRAAPIVGVAVQTRAIDPGQLRIGIKRHFDAIEHGGEL